MPRGSRPKQSAKGKETTVISGASDHSVDETSGGVHSVETTDGDSDHSVVHISAKERGAVEAVDLSVGTPSGNRNFRCVQSFSR